VPGNPTTHMRDGLYRLASLFRLRYPQFKDLVPSAEAATGNSQAAARCKCKTCGEQLDAFGDHGFGCDANKPQRTTLGHNDVNDATRAGAREATVSTFTRHIETPVTDLLPLKAGASPAAVAPRADLVGVCTTGDHPPFVVDVTVVLPHNPNARASTCQLARRRLTRQRQGSVRGTA